MSELRTLESVRSDLVHQFGRPPLDRWEAAVMLESGRGVAASDALDLSDAVADLCDPVHAGPNPRVALVTEGTYPFTLGGVSTWCDQLVRGLSVHRFTVLAVTAVAGRRPVWDLPPNVDDVVELPCWDRRTQAPRRWRTPARPAPAGAELELVRELLDAVAGTGTCPPHRADAIVGAIADAAGGDALSVCLRSDEAVDALGGSFEAAGVAASLHDVGTTLDLLEHYLRPLTTAPPEMDVYHSASNGLAGLVALAGSRATGAPLVLSEHGVYLRERHLEQLDERLGHVVRGTALRFHRLVAGAVYRHAARVLPVSAYNARWALRNGAAEQAVTVIPNGVDPRRVPPGHRGPGRGPTAPPTPAEVERPGTVGFVGRIDRVKDPMTLIEAAASIASPDGPPRVRLWGSVAPGHEDLAAACRERIAELDLDDVVTLEGHTHDPLGAYRSSDVVVSCSISEGLPFGLIEAMMCGRAIVATAVGGVPELLGDTAVLVPPRSPGRVARACSDLLADPERRERLGRSARARALEHFDADLMLSEYRRVYREVAPVIDLRRRVEGAST